VGEYNSTVTRVWPVFDDLFGRDPTGTTWLPALLKLGSRAGKVVQQIHASPGCLLPELGRFELNLPGPIKKALGQGRAARIERIRNAYEAEIPPSATFLQWLLEHPERLVWPKRKNVQWVYGPSTQDKRKCLLAGERAAREEALKELATVGAGGSQRKWWAFEGFTSVDCHLETASLLLLIEGKRKEPISDSTDWFPGRNQVIRNLEVAQALAGRKNFAVLVCAEAPIELAEEAWTNSLPHLSFSEIENLKSHYLGCSTWSAIAQQLCSGLKLPENIDEAIEICLGVRK
jgi:hypothetical protein